jgi:hypothetical protein
VKGGFDSAITIPNAFCIFQTEIKVLNSVLLEVLTFSTCIGIGNKKSIGTPKGEPVWKKKNPGGGEIFYTRPDRPWGPPSLLYNGYRVCPGGKAAGAWC